MCRLCCQHSYQPKTVRACWTVSYTVISPFLALIWSHTVDCNSTISHDFQQLCICCATLYLANLNQTTARPCPAIRNSFLSNGWYTVRRTRPLTHSCTGNTAPLPLYLVAVFKGQLYVTPTCYCQVQLLCLSGWLIYLIRWRIYLIGLFMTCSLTNTLVLLLALQCLTHRKCWDSIGQCRWQQGIEVINVTAMIFTSSD